MAVIMHTCLQPLQNVTMDRPGSAPELRLEGQTVA